MKNNNKETIRKGLKYFWRFLWYSFLSGVLAGLVFVGLYASKTLSETPVITESMIQTSTGETTNMYDKNGTIIYSDTEHRRDYIKLADTPKLYQDILLATENSEFYEENGWSFKGTANAFIGLAKEKILKQGRGRGGSTIEQQLIKNLVFSSNEVDRSIDRKIKEIWLSMQMDKNFSKEQILEWYINLIYLGENSYGANTISITYYGVSLSELQGNDPQTLSKLAIIAGLGQSPSAYNLYDNPTAVEERRNIVLDGAYNKGVLTKEQVEQAKQVPIDDGLKPRYWRNEEVMARTKEHSAYVDSALKQVASLGYDLDKTPMQIYTALDSQYNSDVKSLIDNYYGYQDEGEQVAATIIDPQSGYVMAQYGGRFSEAFGLNRATQTSRSSGSSTKPFISYGPAIEYFGYGSNAMLDSSNYVYPGTNIVAHNDGGYTYGTVTMERAVQLSLNTPAIRILDGVTGSNNTKQFLQGVGLDVQDSYGGQDALGLGVSTEQLAGASAALANYGTYKTPQYITKLVFNDGSEKEIHFPTRQAMKPSTAFILLKMLEKVPTAEGTARSAILPYAGYAVKTGTVGYDDSLGFSGDTASDVWAIGTTKSASIAVWSGYDSPNEPGNQIWYATNNQQKIFKMLMEYANDGKDTSDWKKPETVTQEGAYYKPNDTNTPTTVTYLIPEITVAETPFTVPTNTTKVKVEDEGLSSTYTSKPKDYNDIMNWKDKVSEKDMLAWWNQGYTFIDTLAQIERAYVGTSETQTTQ